MDDRPINPGEYDANYFGWGTIQTSNYDKYSRPHWSLPLANLMKGLNFRPPYLDVGGAFGFLANDLERVTGQPAATLDISEFATQNTQGRNTVRGDGRVLPFGGRVFGTLVSMDFLEHLNEVDCVAAVREQHRVLKAYGVGLHLVGCHTDENPEVNASDFSHRNHQDIVWYRTVFRENGFIVDEAWTQLLNEFRVWKNTDWNGRWLVVVRSPINV